MRSFFTTQLFFMKDKTIKWYNSLSFHGLIGLIFFGILLIGGMVWIMKTSGKALISVESSKVIEQIGNNAVSGLTARSAEIAALTKTLAKIAEKLPKSENNFKETFPDLINFNGDLDIAGGGIWPEPYAFQADKERRSFFWGREPNGRLKYYDDYNQPGLGYHHEEWYIPVRHAKAGTCSWSESYMSPYSFQPMVTCTVATFDHSNNFSGTVTIDLKLEGLHALAKSLRQQTGGYVFIVDRNNKFITFPEPERVKRLDFNIQGNPTQEFILTSELKEPLFFPLSKALDMMNKEILNKALQKSNYDPNIAAAIEHASYKIKQQEAELMAAVIANPLKNNKTHLYTTVHLKNDFILQEASTAFIFHVPDSYWKLVIVKPNYEINTVASHISQVLISYIVATSLLILCLIYFMYSRFLIRPLSQTTIAIREMGTLVTEMKFEQLQILDIPHTQSNEIGLLIDVFDNITFQIIEQHIQLKTVNEALQDNIVQLTQLDELKDEFLANTSHELKTPLNGIIGIAESLVDGVTGELSAQTKANLVMIVGSGKRLSVLVNDILDFSKLKHKTLDIQQASVPIKEIIDIVLTLSKPLLGNKKLELINAVAPDLQPAHADENRLQQILHNLVGNAIKFTETGHIVIYAQVVKDKMEICVSDTGIGIQEDKLERIFESFEQAEGTTSREYGGTGLGLAVTKQLVELHSGKIWIESEIGVGSRFYFTLPVSNETATVPHLAVITPIISSETEEIVQPEKATNSQIKVLIVDDEPVNLQVLKNYLYLEDYNIIQANSGHEALELIEKGLKPDAILLDVMMPKMTGYEVTQKIRENWQADEIPILLLTAKNQLADLVMGLEVGANDYLTKPVSKDELLARLKTHINIKLLKTENTRLGAELEVTRRIQQMLLPKEEELEQVKNLDISGFMEPADEVGGDYYDILQHNGRIILGIGDATGHGLESGMLALMTQAAVRTLLEHGETDTTKFLTSINGMIYKNVQERMLVDKNLSLSILEYQPSSSGGKLQICGQHEELIIVRNGELELIDTSDLGFFIGLVDDISEYVAQTEVTLNTGDVVILYTDGITEAENIEREEYGIERLSDVVKQHWEKTADALKQAIIENVRLFIGKQQVFDDITLLVLKQK